MLLRFGVTNHRSLRDRQEVSLVASSLDDDAVGLIACRHAPAKKLLPVLVVYGANASGKSNLVSAMRWMRFAVLYSHSRGEPDGGMGRMPFALDPSVAMAPSIFEIDFVTNDVRYHYGFEAANNAFVAEWLFAFPNDRRQALFEREAMQFRFGRSLKGRNHIISELTRPNSLFLSAAAQNGHDELTKVSKYFQNMAIDEFSQHELADHLLERPLDERVIGFLKAAGTGVVSYRIKEDDVGPKARQFGEELATLILRIGGPEISGLWSHDKEVKLQLAHQGATEEPIYFEMTQESEGTRRLLAILVPAFSALNAGTVMVVDELDASLHTHACELLIALFSSTTTNPKGAQLIATTHDTNLLRSSHLRRDQVWLTEKDSEGASHLYPLIDFRTRKSDNLERGYLQGRYGSIPFSGDPADVLATL